MDIKLKLRRVTHKNTRLDISLTNNQQISAVIETLPSEFKFNFIGYSSNHDCVYLYLENTSRKTQTIKHIYCNLEDVTSRCCLYERRLLPSSKTLIIYKPKKRLTNGRYLVFKAINHENKAAIASSRVYSYFPITTFGGDTRSSMYLDPGLPILNYTSLPLLIESLETEPSPKVYNLVDDPACRDLVTSSLIGTHAQDVINRLSDIYKLDSLHPEILRCCEYLKPFSYLVYGEIADVFMINPYQMYYFSEQPFRNSEYIALAKRASEPRLLWSIPEAFTHEDNIRFPTPEEERLIVYSEIGEGSKGILYFTSDQRLGYPANVDLESAISGLNQELRLLRSYLVISEPFSLVIKKPDLIKTYSLVCGDKAIVILLLNNNIKSQFEVGKQPFVYQPQRNVQITCQIPKWLKILKVQEVEKHCIKNVPYVIKGNQLTLTIKNLDISRQYLIKTTPAQRGKY